MSDNSIIDLIQDPEGLRRMFAQPYDAEAPPERRPQIDLPEASPLPSVECNVEIRLRARFDPWQIDRIPQAELKQIIWSYLTDSHNYVSGIAPDLTFVSMFLERTDPFERRRGRPLAAHLGDDDGDAEHYRGGSDESGTAGDRDDGS